MLWTSKALFERVELHFYAALAQAAGSDLASAERALRLEAMAPHHRQLQQ